MPSLAVSHGDIKVYRVSGHEGTALNVLWDHGDVFELNYVLSGQFEVVVNDQVFRIGTNETLFFDGLTTHSHKFLTAGEILIVHIPKNSFSLHSLFE